MGITAQTTYTSSICAMKPGSTGLERAGLDIAAGVDVTNLGLPPGGGARIQSFPDSFEFRGSFDDIATQIGNAVPPLLAQHLGSHLQQLAAGDTKPTVVD